jgi:hypothetical protein
MKTKVSRALSVAAAVVLLGAGGCTDTLVEPKSAVTAANIFNDPASYRAFVAKIYAGLALSGQQGPSGRGDIQGIDEGFSHYLRLLWQMQQLPTDETIIGWNDSGLPELNTQLWGSSNQFLVSMYYRIYFQVAMANEFLRETSDGRLSERGVNDDLRAQIQQYRAEARFLRALSYWHGIDLFGNIPLVDEDYPLGATPPPQATRADVFQFVVSELNDIRSSLPGPGPSTYGRANRVAASMLLATLYLNAGVYAGAERYADARAAAEEVINSGAFQLDPDYEDMFLADNHTSPELIFTVPQDGLKTQSWGGTTFLVHAAVGGNMNAGDYGIDFAWWGLRMKPEAYLRYEAGDGRTSYFFTDGQQVQISNTGDFAHGIAAPKFRNVTSSGQAGSHSTHADVDYPIFRLGDAYLIYAEAVLRGGGGSRAQALEYVNALRERAYGDTSGNITDAQLTLDFLLDERSRELLWEGHRRTDLVRFERFSANGVWAWKGAVAAGRTTEAFRDLYPLPGSELLANPNLTQNPGY